MGCSVIKSSHKHKKVSSNTIVHKGPILRISQLRKARIKGLYMILEATASQEFSIIKDSNNEMT